MKDIRRFRKILGYSLENNNEEVNVQLFSENKLLRNEAENRPVSRSSYLASVLQAGKEIDIATEADDSKFSRILLQRIITLLRAMIFD